MCVWINHQAKIKISCKSNRLPFLSPFFSEDLHITIVKRLRTVSVLEGEYCCFECTLSHDIPDEPSWILNGQLIISNGRIHLANQGCTYAMIIQVVMLTDAGEVVFTIKDLSCRTMLFVKGKSYI